MFQRQFIDAEPWSRLPYRLHSIHHQFLPFQISMSAAEQTMFVTCTRNVPTLTAPTTVLVRKDSSGMDNRAKVNQTRLRKRAE